MKVVFRLQYHSREIRCAHPGRNLGHIFTVDLALPIAPLTLARVYIFPVAILCRVAASALGRETERLVGAPGGCSLVRQVPLHGGVYFRPGIYRSYCGVTCVRASAIPSP